MADGGSGPDRVKAELRAAGVPAWAPYSPDDDEVAARYYMWVQSGAVEGRLLLRPDANEPESVTGLLDVCRDQLAGNAAAGLPVDLDAPASLVLVGSNGRIGHGTLGQEGRDMLPLRTLLTLAHDTLSRRLRNAQ